MAHEDDPVRAVRGALAMRQRMAAVNARLQGRIGEPLSLHIGVNTGLVVMTRDLESGPGARLGELVVVGDTVNTAARLQQAAGPAGVRRRGDDGGFAAPGGARQALIPLVSGGPARIVGTYSSSWMRPSKVRLLIMSSATSG